MKSQITQSTFFRKGCIGHRLLRYSQDKGKIVNIWFREEKTVRQILQEMGNLYHPKIKIFHNPSIFRKYCRLVGQKQGEAFLFHFPYTESSLKSLMSLKPYLQGNSAYLLGASFLAMDFSNKILSVEEDGLIVQENETEGVF